MKPVIIEGNCLKVLSRIMQGPPPTLRDLALLTGTIYPNVQYHLARLRRLGLVTWEFNRAATLRPTVRFIPAEELP